MAYPSPDTYNDAVQAPHLAFTDPVLQQATVARNERGLPQAYGGGFVVTYALSHGRRTYAVRCFHREAPDLERRYAHIGAALAPLAGPFAPFVGFEFQPAGIRVRGADFPLVKMEWVNGTPLGIWLERNHRRKSAINTLLTRLRALEKQLREAGLAHGDLQNGNILVQDRGVKLIDYDGMFVPGLDLGQGAELGHRHFQHPQRAAAHFGPEMDRFSFILLDLSLRALAIDPRLFPRYANGENILFCASDFLDPAGSRLFAELRGIRSLAKDVEKFAALCGRPPVDLPTLEDFVGIRPAPPPPPPRPTRPQGPAKTANQLLLEELQRTPTEPLPPEVLIDTGEPQGPLYQPPGTREDAVPQWLVVAGVAAQLLWLGARKGGQAALEVAARHIEPHLPEEPPTATDLAVKALSSLRKWWGSKIG